MSHGSIIYLMSRDQRVGYNKALKEAQQKAIELESPLLVIFQLKSNLGFRQKQHYQFMLQGLKEVEQDLKKLDIPFVVCANSLVKILKSFQPAAIFADFSPLKGHRQRVRKLKQNLECEVKEVDAHNIVPVWQASEKQEYNAYFFRRKLKPKLDECLLEPEAVKKHPFQLDKNKFDLKFENDWEKIEKQIKADDKPGYQLSFEPGSKAAHQQLEQFLENKLLNYDQDRNDPTKNALSGLSPYLHFGQISSLEIALQTKKFVEEKGLVLSDSDIKKLKQSEEGFLEELIVRKELSDNFCYYNSDYDSLQGAPDWALKTLSEHQNDEREYLYDYDQLDQAQTHDDAWNAAQLQMRQTGKMHGYMRMYWAKKILEWTPDAQTAFDYALQLNDTYNLDGHDPNGYVGILWSIAGLHDRPWQERKVFGKVRYMSYDGLKRKFNIIQLI